MAPATLSSSAVDLKSQSSYPLRLGGSILRSTESKKCTSVRYNHKPRLQDAQEAEYRLRNDRETGREELTLKDGKDEYGYSGRATQNDNQYVLVCKTKGNEQEFVLERLEACHEFNLVKTPSEPNAAKLAEKFPQLSVDDAAGDDLFGDADDVEAPVDTSNPWDYRNYLKPNAAKARERDTSTKSAKQSTPQVQPRAASTTPLSQPKRRPDGPLISQKKRKAQDTPKANPKRVKAGIDPPTPMTNKPRSTSDVPRLQIERKATLLRRQSLDDSGELILENETPISEKLPSRQTAMALALSGQLGQGPISLHSAANSPAGSRMASPTPSRPDDIEENLEFEFEDTSSPEAPSKSQVRNLPAEDEDGDAHEDADADADVEDFELPSPAQTHRKSISAATVTNAGDDNDDDDFEKQLAAAMAEEDDGSVQATPQIMGSEEESEEE